MKYITQIKICNYRAFYNEKGNPDKYLINLPKGENLLIYGENGSGKSSFFKALRDIFLSSKEPDLDIQDNFFADVDNPEAEVMIIISDKQTDNLVRIEDVVFNDSSPTTQGNPILTNASANFLTYRDILKTYFLGIDDIDNNPDLFNLIINTLFKNISDSSTFETLSDTLSELEDSVATIENSIETAANLPDDSEPSKTQAETKGLNEIRDEIIESVKSRINMFNISVSDVLKRSLVEVNRYLKDYFNANIEVTIENENLYLELLDESDKFKLNKSLRLDIRYYQTDHGSESYQVFLNEARLSAMAICLYLAAIKLDQASEENLKIIFLDDIFIGLDTSNRIPLLEILNREFKDFQLFITTYDRQWHEIAKNYLDNWNCIEMFVGRNSDPEFEFPVLIDKDLEHIDKARKLIDTYDYFSAGNTIRKGLEKYIEKIVPKRYLINENDLDGLFKQLILFYDKNECGHLIDKDLRRDLYLFKDIILNPASHHDLKCAIYKAEVEKAYRIFRKIIDLPVLKITPVLKVGDSLFYNNPTERYKAQYILTETLYSITYSDSSNVLTNPDHKIVYWSKNGTVYGDYNGNKYDEVKINDIKNKRIRLSERPGRIQHFLNLLNLPDWKNEFTVLSGESLEDLQRAI